LFLNKNRPFTNWWIL